MLALSLVSLLPLCHAFGFPGHELVASLTWDLIPAAIKTSCLGFNSSTPNLSRLHFIKLACRPDRIKHRPGMEWAQPLHFFNSRDSPPARCDGSLEMGRAAEDGSVGGDNLIQAVRNYTAQMVEAKRSGSLSADQRAQVLSFFLHFLTDLHQPLHVSSKLKGGIRLRVRFEGHPKSLHALWDTAMIVKFTREHTLVQQRRIFRKRAMKHMPWNCDEDCITDWAAETNAINCKHVWRIANLQEDFSQSYYKQALPALLDLIVLAAMRTAGVLQLICTQ